MVARNNALRVAPGRRPVRTSLCKNEATVSGASIWITRSRSPTSMPSSSVDVDTITQSRASANTCSAWRRSSADRDECETYVVTPRSRRSLANSSTGIDPLELAGGVPRILGPQISRMGFST